MGQVVGFARFVAAGVRFAAGMLAAWLPRRWWDELELYVPVRGAAAASGAATILLAAAIGIPGFLAYAGYTASAHNDAALQGMASGDPALDNEGALRRMPMAFNVLAPLVFLALTRVGWVTCYLSASGAVRLASALLDEGTGDPLVTGTDALVRRTISGSRTQAARVARERHEGPEVPDRIVSARQLAIDGAEFVVVASRRKPGWERGTVVLTPDGTAYRIGVVEDRTIAGRLRALYGLSRHTDLEAFRRVVHYDDGGQL